MKPSDAAIKAARESGGHPAHFGDSIVLPILHAAYAVDFKKVEALMEGCIKMGMCQICQSPANDHWPECAYAALAPATKEGKDATS